MKKMDVLLMIICILLTTFVPVISKHYVLNNPGDFFKVKAIHGDEYTLVNQRTGVSYMFIKKGKYQNKTNDVLSGYSNSFTINKEGDDN